MERKSKWLSLLMASCLLIGILPVTSFAEEPGELYVQTDSTEVESRQGHVGEVLSMQEHRAIETRTRSLQADGYLDTVAEAAAMLREGMKNRQEQIEIRYMADADSSYEQIASSIQSAALAHTGVPTEGDYLLWQIGQMYSSANYYIQGDTAYYEMIFCVEYYTSWGEEQWVTERVEDLLGQLISDEMTDYVKIQTVYDWICKNVCYDHDNLEVDSYKTKYTAYAALINGTAVCQGYATLMYRLALEMGIDCRVIAGVSSEERHSWNIVQLDGVYYNLDATWDSEHVQAGKPIAYFLCNDKSFFDHTRDPEYLTDAFLAEYTMPKVSYGKEENWTDHMADTYAGGTGTKEDPYLISTPEELARLSTCQAPAYYKLIRDIDLGQYPWKPISRFTGVLDGDSHKIYNLTITKESHEHCGLIAFADGAEIHNLRMENCSIQNVDTKDYGIISTNVGLLVGIGWNCTIRDCEIDGSIQYRFENAGSNMGLVIGAADCDTVISNVHANGSLDVRTENGGLQVGGVIGGVIGLVRNVCLMEQSSFSGTMDVFADSILADVACYDGWAVNVGGLIGGVYWSKLTMRNCYSIVNANVESTDSVCIGGAIGWINNIDDDSVDLSKIYSVARMTGKGMTLDDSYCGLFNGGGTLVGSEIAEDLFLDSNSSITDCGYFAHDKVFVYDNCDAIGPVCLFEDIYALDEYTVTEIFLDMLQFDASVWDITDGSYPVLKGQKKTSVPWEFEHNYWNQVCSICGAVDRSFSTSGTWGSLNWRVDNGVLTISGEGRMPNGVYNDVIYRNEFPWSYFGVEKIIIEPGITNIAEYAFWYMDSVREVSLPDTLEYIGYCAFMGCRKLEGVYIPAKTMFSGSEFDECKRLKAIEVDPGNPYSCSIDGVVYSKDKETLVKIPGGYSGDVVIPNGVVYIGADAAKNCIRISSVELPDTVTKIGYSAFSGNQIKSITLPNSITQIDDFAFCSNFQLTEITIPNSVQELGYGAFDQCYNLNKATLGTGLKTIEGAIFRESNITDIVIPRNIKSIPESMFSSCQRLKSVRFAGEIESIGDSTFQSCFSLQDIYYALDESSWKAVEIGGNNEMLMEADVHFNEGNVYIAGDINGDGAVNNKDATRLFQYMTGWRVEVVEAALDVNGDGKVNNKDATRLFQYLSGWPVEIY